MAATTSMMAGGMGGSEDSGTMQTRINEVDTNLSQNEVRGISKGAFDPERVFESDLYKISTSTLKDDRLKDNIFYEKLISRLN